MTDRFAVTCADGVCRLDAPGARWLQTGYGGGYETADAAYNVTVPEGFDRTDLDVYGVRRRERAGLDTPGPTLFTGVEQQHARGARCGPVTAVATAGVSNPAALPMPESGFDANHDATEAVEGDAASTECEGDHPTGTVNVLVAVARDLDDGALASLLGVVVEAKAATLLAVADVPGTTTDAVAVGSVQTCEAAAFAGSGTAVGGAARACVRAAVGSSLASRYADKPLPDGVADAEYGVATTQSARVFEL